MTGWCYVDFRPYLQDLCATGLPVLRFRGSMRAAMMLQNTPSVARRSDRERRRYDGRSSTAVRIRALVKEYTAIVGDAADNTTMAAAIRRAAELQALAEDARAAAVRNGVFDPIALARIEGIADRAKRALNLDRKPDDGVSDLDRYLQSREAGS
jgi:hypothetical protein